MASTEIYIHKKKLRKLMKTLSISMAFRCLECLIASGKYNYLECVWHSYKLWNWAYVYNNCDNGWLYWWDPAIGV